MTAPDTAITDEAALQMLADYYRAFSTLDVQAVWPYFHEPSLLISPQGVFAVPTVATLATVFSPTMEGLRAREFGRSELTVGKVTSLSASATLVTGIAIRYKRDGQELERAGITYVLRKSETDWKIAVIILHDVHQSPR
ncbi:MAG TPA: nuclear transport factor 2 family protein [Bryobacteraceae bacterium]|nr:nuclear transport factor 2 family protein [Bryobacteraceae bacterium]